MGERSRNIMVRSASAVVFAAVVFGATLWSKWSFGVLLATVLVGSAVELYRLFETRGIAPLRMMGCISTLGLFALAFTVFIQDGTPVETATGRLFLALVVYLLLMLTSVFVCELWRCHPTPMQNVASTLSAVAYVGIPLSLLLFIPQLLVGSWCPYVMLSYILLVWVNDVFAFFFGMFLGRHHMCERISPKKTWEGFAGGVIMTILAGGAAGYFFEGNVALWAGLGAVVATTGVAGDFVESLFKRQAEVKDSGAIMPGHGGFLDRFDAMLVSAPYAFVYLIICNM